MEASRHPPVSHLRVRHSAFQIAAHHGYLDRDQVIGYGDLHGDRGSFRNDSMTKIDWKAHDDIFKCFNALVGVGVAGASTNTQNMSALQGLQDVTYASFQQLTAV